MSALKMLSSMLAQLVKNVAEGDPDSPTTKFYWWLAGKKTWISLGLFALYAFIVHVLLPVFTQCGEGCGATPEVLEQLTQYAGYIPKAAEILLAFGLFDAAVRIEPPVKS